MDESQCYCLKFGEDVKRMMRCGTCNKHFHLDCLKSRKPSQLMGDIFFHFTCAVCSDMGVEKFERMKLLWLPVVILTLYNLQLSSTGQLGYYRWKEHICSFIESHWVEFFGTNRKKTQTWYGTVAGTLSSWCPTYFVSGIHELKQSGWWKLADTSSPTVDVLTATRMPKKAKSPNVSVGQKPDGLRNRAQKSSIESAIELRAKRDIPVVVPRKRKKKRTCDEELGNDMLECESPLHVDESYDDDDDADLCSVMTDVSQMSASSLNAFDQSSQLSRSSCKSDWLTERDLVVGDTVPEFLLKDDEDDDADIDPCALSPAYPSSPIMQSSSCEDNLPQLSDILSAYGSDHPQLGDLLSNVPSERDSSSAECSLSAPKELQQDYKPNVPFSCSSVLTMNEVSSCSFSDNGDMVMSGYQSDVDGSEADEKATRRRRARPVDEMVPPPVDNMQLVPMSLYEEKQLLQKLKWNFDHGLISAADVRLKRFYRKLCVRQEQRERGLKVFNVDAFVNHLTNREHENSDVHIQESEWCKADIKPDLSDCRILDRYQRTPQTRSCAQPVSFLSRLIGDEDQLQIIHSPYTNRALKPFIRRDFESRPLKMCLLHEIVAYHNRRNPDWKPDPLPPIDYCYVRPQHIPAVNALCREYFWPGIDLSECLEYPDFSGIVLYRKLIIGFAFMVPDVKYNEAYISFIFTHPEWRHAGIGSFLLYHLIQTCMGKDVTLHVSASNPAMLLYQKFGFKTEEFVLDFYEKYFPAESTECRHAFFLRLKR